MGREEQQDQGDFDIGAVQQDLRRTETASRIDKAISSVPKPPEGESGDE